jgi:hypothetical protein
MSIFEQQTIDMKLPFITILCLVLASCTNNSQFLIQKNQVGPLTAATKVAALDSLYASDSLVRRVGEGDYVQAGNDTYLLYDNQGNPLLSLIPKQQFDPQETIETIQIIDSRYTTSEGLTSASTFGELKAAHHISSIQNTIKSVLVFVDELDIYVTIDKKELPLELRYGTDQKIEAVHIPDDAVIKSCFVGWV